MFEPSHFHPMIVHFPVAIIFIGFLFDLSSLFITKEKCLSKMGLYLEVIGMFAAIAAFGTGFFLQVPWKERPVSFRKSMNCSRP